MEARSKALGTKADGHGAEHLCGEVVHALKRLTDEEIAHIPSKTTYRSFCEKRFNINSSANDFFAEIKHYFVLGTRAETKAEL